MALNSGPPAGAEPLPGLPSQRPPSGVIGLLGAILRGGASSREAGVDLRQLGVELLELVIGGLDRRLLVGRRLARGSLMRPSRASARFLMPLISESSAVRCAASSSRVMMLMFLSDMIVLCLVGADVRGGGRAP
ncbi:MAG: hypothetical protein IPO75_14370 [Betaproteobacteria bacterium]|nr:hypothetical protein [Betaproteobacteria bacterium]